MTPFHRQQYGTARLARDAPGLSCETQRSHCGGHHPNDCAGWLQWRYQSLVGIRRDGIVAGVRVVAHRETPGLGDKVDLRKSDWVLGFNDRSLSQPGAE